jgi:hypothetical protein
MGGELNKTSVIAIFLLLLCLQCTENQERKNAKSLGYPLREDTIKGIKTIMNPDYPRDGRAVYTMTDVVTLGSEGEPEDGILFYPHKIRVDALDNIYVSDAVDKTIKIYDRSGKWIKNVGKRGQGPGEFMAINGYDVTGDGRIFISDIRQHRVSILSNDGTFVSSFLTEHGCARLKVDEEGRVYLQLSISSGPLGQSGSKDMEMIIKRTDFRGKNPREYGRFPAGKYVWGPKKTNGATVITGHVSPDAYTTSWIVGKSGRLYLGNNRDYLISILNERGKLIFRFGREFTYIKHPLYSPDLAHPEHYPAFYSRYFFFDDEENLWLMPYTDSNETDHLYDVFSPEGIFIRQAVVPEKILQYQNGKACTIAETESGDYLVKYFTLVKN